MIRCLHSLVKHVLAVVREINVKPEIIDALVGINVIEIYIEQEIY